MIIMQHIQKKLRQRYAMRGLFGKEATRETL